MNRLRRVCELLCIYALLLGADAPKPAGESLILDTSSFYRTTYVLSGPVVRKGEALDPVEIRGGWLMRGTPDVAPGWTAAEFGDSGWVRTPMCDPDSPYIARVCLRGKFAVANPQAARLKMSLWYHGGAVVYVNGTEVARGNVAAAGMGEDYPAAAEAKTIEPRAIEGVAIPAGVLRKGVNVLAVEVRRSPLREGDVKRSGREFSIARGFCGAVKLRLVAEGGEGVVPNVVRPKGLQVWNSDASAADFDLDWGDPNEPLKPIRLVAPRGGVASGKVVVGSTEALKGLTAQAGGLTCKGATAQVRYALATGSEGESDRRYTLSASRFDALDDAPPAEVAVAAKRAGHYSRKLPDEPAPVAGAVCPVWVTVQVPADAVPGDYAGMLTIECGVSDVAQPPSAEAVSSADVAQAPSPAAFSSSQSGAAAPRQPQQIQQQSHPGAGVPHKKTITVPIELKVSSYRAPPPAQFRTFVEIVQSPETTAMYYEAPLWSDRHFGLIAKSLDLLGEVGNKTCHLMLIADTNQGNDETMVRWIKQPNGSYKHDFSVLERYLDAVIKHQGKPEVVCLYVWDTYLEGGQGGPEQWAGDAVKKDRAAHAGLGPIVTLFDPASQGSAAASPATGRSEKLALPSYLAPESAKLWEPVIRGVLERLKARGLDKAAMLGIGTDNIPTKEIVEFFKTVAPGLPWISHSHPYRTDIQGVPTGYASGVWSGGVFAQDPSLARTYGWKRKDLAAHFPRSTFDYWPMTTWRFQGEMNIAGSQRGFARFGGDFFGVLKDKRGYTRGSLSSRFPKTSWRNLDIRSALLAAGKDGPVATARFEMIREGLQECEARIAIEEVLTDPARRAKLGEPIAVQYQSLLDERTRDMRRAVSTLRSATADAWTSHADIDNTWWQAPGVLGSLWFVSSGWQDKTAALFEAAAVAEKAR